MKSFIKELLNSRVVVVILVFLLIFGLAIWGVSKYQSLETDLEIASQNQSALRDSLRVSKNKVGDLEFSKQVLVAKNKSDVKKLNDRLDDVRKKFTGKVSELTETLASVKGDTVFIDKTEVVDLPNNTKVFSWEYSKVYDERNSRHLSGETRFKLDTIKNELKALGTRITRDDINFNVIQGLRTTEDGKVEMFAASDYPNFEVEELNSVIIEPSKHPVLEKFTNKRKVKFGFYSGFGATVNLTNSSITFGPQVGLGIIF